MVSARPIPGEMLGHYRILEQIGAGGMGVVFRAYDERLERDVALKVLPMGTLADASAHRRFRKEGLTLSRLNHPNIATVHDFDTYEGIDFLVTEFIPGMSLNVRLSGEPLAEEEVVRIGMQLTEGLEAAHREGILHGDLKPANLRMTPEGRLKILDFGLARRLAPLDAASTTQSATQISTAGTPGYMAPEQLKGEKVDTRADLWAVGVVLYELATGRRPFEGKTTTALADEIFHAPAPSPQTLHPGLSPGLVAIILKCLEKDPENRYQSAKELLVDLRRLGRPGSTSVAEPRRERRARWPALVAAAAVLVILVAGLIALNLGRLRHRRAGSASSPHIHSLGVLPLENLSGDPGQEYFVDGMHEELIATLGKIGSLTIISRTSVMQYKGTRKPVRQIAKELGVDAVVEGSVRRAAEQVRVTVRLTDAATERNLWTDSYQRKLGDTLALQSDVARAIAQEIKIAVTPAEETRLAKAHPVNAETHDSYLRGRYHWNKRTSADLEKAREYFREAIERDPDYALAYAGLADCYYVAAARDFLLPVEAYQQAETAAKKALQLDDLLAEAHAALGGVSASKNDWVGAEREYRRAIELNSSYATAHHWYSIYLAAMGRFDEAIAEIKRAHELDPFSLIISDAVGWPFYLARQYDRAIEQYQRTIQMDPNFPPPYIDLGRAYLHKGMVEEAIKVHLRLDSLSGGHPAARAELGHTYAVAGRKGAALKILNELRELSKQRYVSPYDIARIYVGLAEKEQALDCLESAFEERSEHVMNLKVDPDLDPLRSEPRFHDLISRLKFPQ